ncbi:DUF1611 domain-containing protein, partial [Elstera cyanobacteriorum]|uniref:DUF1611 domain-containing protein n=1 Tax=Elstera cyanobacteriorum TaxID=2022747 RepID=UPI0023F01690
MQIERPYLLFLGDARDQLAAKTADGIRQWRPDWCVGQWRLAGCKADLGLKDMDARAARDKGAKTVVIGVANRGGVLGPSWIPLLVEAEVALGRPREALAIVERGRARAMLDLLALGGGDVLAQAAERAQAQHDAQALQRIEAV